MKNIKLCLYFYIWLFLTQLYFCFENLLFFSFKNMSVSRRSLIISFDNMICSFEIWRIQNKCFIVVGNWYLERSSGGARDQVSGALGPQAHEDPGGSMSPIYVCSHWASPNPRCSWGTDVEGLVTKRLSGGLADCPPTCGGESGP